MNAKLNEIWNELETHQVPPSKMDSLSVYDIHYTDIQIALEKAYEAGLNANDTTKQDKPVTKRISCQLLSALETFADTAVLINSLMEEENNKLELDYPTNWQPFSEESDTICEWVNSIIDSQEP